MKKSAIIFGILFLINFNQQILAQTKNENKFYFCSETEDILSIQDLENCNLKSKKDKNIVVLSFTLSYQDKSNKGDYYEFKISGDKVSKDFISTLKSRSIGEKIIIEDIKYKMGEKTLKDESCVFKFSSK